MIWSLHDLILTSTSRIIRDMTITIIFAIIITVTTMTTIIIIGDITAS